MLSTSNMRRGLGRTGARTSVVTLLGNSIRFRTSFSTSLVRLLFPTDSVVRVDTITNNLLGGDNGTRDRFMTRVIAGRPARLNGNL